MYLHELNDDSQKEQQLWEDLLKYGSDALLKQPETEVSMCYLGPQEIDKANFYLSQSGMLPVERIGVGFSSSEDGPITLHSPDLKPYVMLFSPDKIALRYSLHSGLGGLMLRKDVIVVSSDLVLENAPVRESLHGADKHDTRLEFQKLISQNEASLATEDECNVLLCIFSKSV